MSYSTSANLIWPMAAWRLSLGLFFDVENTITYVSSAHLSLIGAHLPVSGVNWGKWGDRVGRAFLGESASTPLCHRGRQIRAGGSGRPCQTPECWDKSFHHKHVERPWIVPSAHSTTMNLAVFCRVPQLQVTRWWGGTQRMALGSTLKLLRLPSVFALPISAACYALRALIGLVIIRPF